MGEISFYNQMKSTILGFRMEDNALAYSLASMILALCSTAISCASDIAKMWMMNQAGNEYSEFVNCAEKSVRREGIFALWKGFFPTLARLGPWQFFFWASYEKFLQSCWTLFILIFLQVVWILQTSIQSCFESSVCQRHCPEASLHAPSSSVGLALLLAPLLLPIFAT